MVYVVGPGWIYGVFMRPYKHVAYLGNLRRRATGRARAHGGPLRRRHVRLRGVMRAAVVCYSDSVDEDAFDLEGRLRLRVFETSLVS